MIAALLPVESSKLSQENAEQHVLVLELELAEAQFYIFQVGEEDKEEFQSWIHRKFSEQNRRGAECEAQANLGDLELLDVNLFDISLCVHVWLSFLFHLVEGTLDLSYFITNICAQLRLLKSGRVCTYDTLEKSLVRLGPRSEF